VRNLCHTKIKTTQDTRGLQGVILSLLAGMVVCIQRSVFTIR